jgi:hypothetical protein
MFPIFGWAKKLKKTIFFSEKNINKNTCAQGTRQTGAWVPRALPYTKKKWFVGFKHQITKGKGNCNLLLKNSAI